MAGNVFSLMSLSIEEAGNCNCNGEVVTQSVLMSFLDAFDLFLLVSAVETFEVHVLEY